MVLVSDAETGADKNVNGTYVAQAAIEGRSLYGLPRPNGTAQPYATPQGDSMYVYLGALDASLS